MSLHYNKPERPERATIFESIDDRLAQLQHDLMMRWLVAVVGLLIAFGGLSFALAQVHSVAVHAHQTAVAVQIQRTESIRRSCIAQNTHNQQTSRQLRIEINQAIQKFPKRKPQLLISLKETQLLINDLAPVQNCNQIVKQSTHIPTHTSKQTVHIPSSHAQ